MNDHEMYLQPVAEAAPDVRARFLRRVALLTLGGLVLTAVSALVSMMTITPWVLGGGTWAVLGVVYGAFFGAQILGRRMVYGASKAGGLVLGAVLQGVALSFLLVMALVSAAPGEGLALIGYALLMVVLSVAAMLLYVTQERREFSMLRAGLTMLGIPMLIMMGLQLVLPMDGMLGVVVSGVFLAVSVGALLYTLNKVIHEFPAEASSEAAFELTIGIVVFFWNLLSFLMRLRRR